MLQSWEQPVRWGRETEALFADLDESWVAVEKAHTMNSWFFYPESFFPPSEPCPTVALPSRSHPSLLYNSLLEFSAWGGPISIHLSHHRHHFKAGFVIYDSPVLRVPISPSWKNWKCSFFSKIMGCCWKVGEKLGILVAETSYW